MREKRERDSFVAIASNNITYNKTTTTKNTCNQVISLVVFCDDGNDEMMMMMMNKKNLIKYSNKIKNIKLTHHYVIH